MDGGCESVAAQRSPRCELPATNPNEQAWEKGFGAKRSKIWGPEERQPLFKLNISCPLRYSTSAMNRLSTELRRRPISQMSSRAAVGLHPRQTAEVTSASNAKMRHIEGRTQLQYIAFILQRPLAKAPTRERLAHETSKILQFPRTLYKYSGPNHFAPTPSALRRCIPANKRMTSKRICALHENASAQILSPKHLFLRKTSPAESHHSISYQNTFPNAMSDPFHAAQVPKRRRRNSTANT